MTESTRPFYDRESLEFVFTPERISEQGQYLLKRALNIGRVVAFAGSGLSAAYGRPTWTQLIENAQEARQDQPKSAQPSDEERKLLESALKGKRDELTLMRLQEILSQELLDIRSADASVVKKWSEQKTTHLTEQILRDVISPILKELKEAGNETAFSDPDLLPLRAHILQLSATSNGAGDELLRRLLKEDTRAEALGLRRRMADLFEKFDASKDPFALKRNSLSRRWMRAAFKPALAKLPMVSAALKGEGDLNAEEVAVMPLVGLRMKLATSAPTLPGLRPASRPIASKPLDDDPIREMFSNLELRRVVTTNYDFELEHNLEHVGFPYGGLRQVDSEPQPPDGRYVTSNTRGQKARASVLKSETAIDLIDFAVGYSSFAYDIFHLHGRAGTADPLVATERDYQDLYLRYSPQRHEMSEALRVLFAGNPILFLGLGMQEADILRPLRRFMSDPETQTNRAIFALMPAEAPKPRRTRNALQHYLAYGVHTLYFGHEWRGRAPSSEREKQAAPWADAGSLSDDAPLYLAIRRLGALKKAFKDLAEKPEASEALVFLDWLKSLIKAPAPELVSSLFGAGFMDLARNKPQGPGNGTAVRDGWLEDDPETMKPEGRSVVGAALCDFPAVLREWIDATPAERASMSSLVAMFVGELETRVRTLALTQALRALEYQRRDWWTKWRALPTARARALRPSLLKKNDEPGKPLLKWEIGEWNATNANAFRVVRYSIPEANKPLEDGDELRRWLHDEVGPKTGRRVRLMIGARGVGKGQLFHDLEHRLMWPTDQGRKNLLRFGVFSNAAFSTEYGSVVAGVLRFLEEVLGHFDPTYEATSEASRADAMRIRLEAVRKKLVASSQPSPRLLFVFSGFESLFRRDGSPKNRDLAEAIAVLLDKAFDNTPFDIVFICQEERAASIFISDERAEGLRRGVVVTPLRAAPESPERETPVDSGAQFLVPVGSVRLTPVRLAEGINEIRALGALAHVKRDGPEAVSLEQRLLSIGSGKVKIEVKRLADALPAATEPDITVEGSSGKDGEQTSDDATLAAAAPAIHPLGGQFIRTALLALPPSHAMRREHSMNEGEGKKQKGDKQRKEERELRASLRKEFLDNLLQTPLPKSADRRSEHLLELLLAQYEAEASAVPYGELYHRLDEVVLKHLAIISGPAEAGVLADLPEVRRVADQVVAAVSDKPMKLTPQERADKRFAVVLTSLKHLEQAKLIFALTARSDVSKDEKFNRYGAHPVVQGYFFRRIGSPHLEFGDSRLFTVSLWGSQPSDLPAPTRESYEFLDGLLCDLIGYPNPASELERLGPSQNVGPVENRAKAELDDLRVCRLRAAVSLVRSAFSLAVVTRYADFGERTPRRGKLPAQGYLEAFRVRLLWMIYMASELDSKERRPEQSEGVIDALYPDELTWLLNECALVSLVQGEMHDAATLFDRAIEANRAVEGDRPGAPNALRLTVNRAVASIERGALDAAAAALRGVRRHNTEEPEVYAMTEAALGLVAHLRGRRSQAARRYGRAASALGQVTHAGRGLSIVYRHWADLERAHGDIDKARAKINAAKAEAQASSQQDQVHWCHLAEAHIEMVTAGVTASALVRANRRLAEADTYARLMEIHTLQADVMGARAVLSLRQGETRSAGDFAVESTSVATLHGLRLRALSGLIRIGHIAKRRGHGQAGDRLIRSAMEACDKLGYQPAINRAAEALFDD